MYNVYCGVKMVYMHTPDDDDSPPRMMDPGQNEKSESFYVSVYYVLI